MNYAIFNINLKHPKYSENQTSKDSIAFQSWIKISFENITGLV